MVSSPDDGSRPCLPPSMLRPALNRVPSQPIAVHGRHRAGPERPRHLRQPRSAVAMPVTRSLSRAGALQLAVIVVGPSAACPASPFCSSAARSASWSPSPESRAVRC